MKRVGFFFVALAATLLAAGAYAQTTGSIAGTIIDENRAPLPGVTVEANSPALATSKIVATESNGRFRIDGLPPGEYTIKCTLEGFATLEQANIRVVAGSVANLQVQMRSAIKEEMTVTGSLIPRPTLEAMSPVSTLDVEQLSYEGTARLEDMLTTLPQVFRAQNATVANGASGTATVDLRFLGPQRTLVLLDGKRMPVGDTGGLVGAAAVAPDLNFIPAALVKRVDILTGGASATYGADAVSGVVNFILDTDFEGIRAGVSGGGFNHNNNNQLAREINTANGFTVPEGQAYDGGQFDAYVAYGGKFADGKGHASLYLDYRKTAALLKNRRDYTNCSVSDLGDTGPACGGSSTNPYGRFLTDDGGDYQLNPATGNTFEPWSYLYNYGAVNFMQRPDVRYAGGGFLNYDWNEHYKGYLSVMMMDDNTDAQIAPSGDFFVTSYINCDNPMLSADQFQKICTNAGYGPGIMGPDGVIGDAGVAIGRRNVEGGNRTDLLTHDAYRLLAGLKGEIGTGWAYDVYGLQAQTRVPETYVNDMNSTRLQNALFVTGDPNDPSTWQCRDATARAEGCVPWDIFRTGGVTQAALNYLAIPLVSNSQARTQVISGKLTADLKEAGVVIPSATEGVQLALGAEYRKESMSFQADLAYQMGWGAGQGGPRPSISGGYDVKEEFGEVLIPIAQGMRGAKDLSLELGYRSSDYNWVGGGGRFPTWKVQASYAPAADLKFRAGKNRATRSPNVNELFAPRAVGLSTTATQDICAGANPSYTLEQCERTGVTAAQYGNILENPASQYNVFAGGTQTLTPEIADTITYGMVITPSGFPGFTATLDYYDIKLKDTIGALGADSVVKACAETGNPALCSLVHRDARGTLWLTPQGYTITTNLNFGNLEAKGMDVTAGYSFPAGDTFFTLNLIGTYTLSSKTAAIIAGTPLYNYDCVGFFGNQCGQPVPKWRHLFRTSWETGPVVVSVGWRMIGAVTVDAASPDLGLSDPGKIPLYVVNGSYKYPAFHYIDLAVSYKLKAGVQFLLGINNIADKEPPLGSGFSPNDFGTGFFGTYDPYGRFIHSSVTFSF